jgi:hypothetical protein
VCWLRAGLLYPRSLVPSLRRYLRLRRSLLIHGAVFPERINPRRNRLVRDLIDGETLLRRARAKRYSSRYRGRKQIAQSIPSITFASPSLACYGTTRRGLCFGEQASTENRYVCWSTDSRSIAGLSVRFDLLRRKSGWRGIGRRTSLEQQSLDPPVGMVHSVYMDAESSCPTPTHITEEQISFLADLADLQFPERDLRSVASALSAHLALGDVLLREDLANVLPTTDPRWHD